MKKNKNRGYQQLRVWKDAISTEKFEKLDALAFKLENGLLKFVESLERKRNENDWIDTLVIKERFEVYYADKSR